MVIRIRVIGFPLATGLLDFLALFWSEVFVDYLLELINPVQMKYGLFFVLRLEFNQLIL